MLRQSLLLACVAIGQVGIVGADEIVLPSPAPAAATVVTTYQTPQESAQVLIQAVLVELRGDVEGALQDANLGYLTAGGRFGGVNRAEATTSNPKRKSADKLVQQVGAIEQYKELHGAKRSNYPIPYSSNRAPVEHKGAGTLDQLLGTLKKHAELEVLSRPMIRTLSGQPAKVQIGVAVPNISYLVRTGEKTFELKEATFDAPLGIAIEVMPRVVAGDPQRVEISPLKVSSTTLDGRELLAGVDLDVGKPIVCTRAVETSVSLTGDGSPTAVLIPSPPGSQAVLLLSARVDRSAEKKDRKKAKETTPNPSAGESAPPKAEKEGERPAKP